MKSVSKRTVLVAIAFIYMTISTFAALRFYDMYKYYEARVPKTEKDVEKETNMLIAQLKKIMAIPDEKPVVATVTDKNTLKAQQSFFAQAENGDKVIVFSKARKAVLYRPSTNKIIESGPLLVSPNQTTTGQQIQTIKVAIYNGTTDTELGKTTEDRLKKAAGPVIETTLTNAKSSEYKNTIVIDLTGNNKQSVDDIAKFLQAEVGSLPSSETKPDADVLIILGTEK